MFLLIDDARKVAEFMLMNHLSTSAVIIYKMHGCYLVAEEKTVINKYLERNAEALERVMKSNLSPVVYQRVGEKSPITWRDI